MACDMQMYLVGLFFAMLIMKHPKVAKIGLVASNVAVTALDVLIVYDQTSFGSTQRHENSYVGLYTYRSTRLISGKEDLFAINTASQPYADTALQVPCVFTWPDDAN